MRRILLCLLCVTLHIPKAANATVIEFNSDGSVTTFEASDYLANIRHLQKKPKVFNLTNVRKPKDDFGRFIEAAAMRHDIDSRIIHAVIETESFYQPDAVSPKGAQGLMQLMPATAKQYGVTELFDPEKNINVGTEHLKYLLDKYEGDLPLAIAAYNAGEGAVKKYEGIPPYPETIGYVKKITALLDY